MVKLLSYWVISSKLLVKEAEEMGMEVEIIQRDKNLFRITNGEKSHVFKWSDCWVNSSLGLKIANDKELTYVMLQNTGVPLAKTIYVKQEDLGDDIFKELEYPVVIKPLDGAHGQDVVMNINSKKQVEENLIKLFESHTTLIVQEQVEGNEFRVMVFDDECVCAFQRRFPTVTWDGEKTVRELIKHENETNPERGEGYEKCYAKIRIDEECKKCVQKEWYRLDQVLEKWEEIKVRSNSNVGSWGTIVDVTDSISSYFKEIAIKAAKACHLRFCGLDIITHDITWWDGTKSTILEIWATPGIWVKLNEVNVANYLIKKICT